MNDSYLTSVSNLKGWYKNKFEIIERYCVVLLDGVDRVTKNNIMLDIVNEFLKGQEDNISVKEIIGDDIEKYCHEKCDNVPKRYKFKDSFRIVMYWALVLLVFEGSEILFNIGSLSILNIKTNIHSLIVSVLFCSFIIYIYNGTSKGLKKSKIFFSSLVLLSSVVLAIHITFRFNILIPVVYEVIFSLLIVLSYIICYRKSSLSKLEYIDMSVKTELQNCKKELQRINNKNKRKGKELLTEEQYLDMKMSSSIRSLKLNRIDLFLPIIFSIIPICFTILNNNIVDSVLYFLILLIIEYIIFIPVYSNSKRFNKLLLEKYNNFKVNNIPVNKWE